MNMCKILFTAFVLIGILPFTATAIPGITVTIDPLNKDTPDDITVDYLVTITNDDDNYDKTITSLQMEITQTGWTYSIDPPTTSFIPAGMGNSITTTLHVSVPRGTRNGIYYIHRINAVAEYELYPGCLSEFGDASICVLTENDPEDFNTHIIGGTQNTEIPEFPTIALPVISILGLIFVMRRKK